jgi:cytochrome c oxidase subunit 2
MQKTILLQYFSNPASQQAEKISSLLHSFNIAAGGMLLLVSFLVTYICIKFRHRKGDDVEPKQTTGSGKLEALMIGVPALLLIYFFYETVITVKAISPTVNASMKPDVIITGHQWWWEVEYPSTKMVTANEVHLPVGKQLLLELRTKDVIHDWWVPGLGNKMDMIPNRTNFLWVNINKPGDYIGACSEFCGAQHAWMRIKVVAQSTADYNNWLMANTKKAAEPMDKEAIAGKELFQNKSCAGCHRIEGTSAIAVVGPDLTHLAGRQYLLTGLLANNESNLNDWINHPQQIKPGAHMPDFMLEKDSLRAIAHYLSQLK